VETGIISNVLHKADAGCLSGRPNLTIRQETEGTGIIFVLFSSC
jgi:hypothetical protein